VAVVTAVHDRCRSWAIRALCRPFIHVAFVQRPAIVSPARWRSLYHSRCRIWVVRGRRMAIARWRPLGRPRSRQLDPLGWLYGVIIISALAALLWEWRIGAGADKSTKTTLVTVHESCLYDVFQGYRHGMDDWNERNEPASTDTMWHDLLDCQASLKERWPLSR
jgi:hypothetical protein